MTYAVVIEKTGNGYSAYVPDLSGCIAAGDTREETEALIQEALAFHIEDLAERGEPVPAPKMSIGEALAHHIAILSEAVQPVPELETTFAMVAVEAKQEPSPAATTR